MTIDNRGDLYLNPLNPKNPASDGGTIQVTITPSGEGRVVYTYFANGGIQFGGSAQAVFVPAKKTKKRPDAPWAPLQPYW